MVELYDMNSIEEADLKALKITPDTALVRTQHANFEEESAWGSNHNLIWPKSSNNSDPWNKWHCDQNESWVEVDFQQKLHVVCMVGFQAAQDDNNPTSVKI